MNQPSPPRTLEAERPMPAESALLRHAARREQVEQLVERRARDLLALAPGLRLRRAFYDGAWVVGLHPAGEAAGRAFSRLDVEIRYASDDGTLELTVRGTAHGHDLPRRTITAGPGEDAPAELTPFVETALLAFAERYFDRS